MDDLLASRIACLAERDRHLLQEIVYGATRHRNTLDAIVDHHLKNPTSKQRPPLSWSLRIGAYQLIYLDRVPPHAAVNQTLEGLKWVGVTGAGEVGFVNAVLHKIVADIRVKSEDPPVDRDDPTIIPVRRGFCHFNRPILRLFRVDPAGHLAVKYSHPIWMVKLWGSRYGDEEARSLMSANNVTPPLTARVTRLAPSIEDAIAALASDGWTAGPGPLEGTIAIQKAGSLAECAAFHRGWFLIQDATAIQIGRVLAPPAGARVLDLCSAPGGKASQLLEAVGPDGHVVAADRSEEKLSSLRETLSRIGTNYSTVLVPEDPAAIDLGDVFTHIMVDAPCSNTGVLARRPEARWRVRAQDIQSLARLQAGLLEAALRHLAPGGRILYATCSIEPEENENVVAEVFAAHPELTELETKLFLPHRSQGDGGFYSLLQKGR